MFTNLNSTFIIFYDPTAILFEIFIFSTVVGEIQMPELEMNTLRNNYIIPVTRSFFHRLPNRFVAINVFHKRPTRIHKTIPFVF
jgi:hypothetical protein